jgi:iron(II)-dependent oxidoreductase
LIVRRNMMFRLIWVVFLMGCITSAISDDDGDGDGDGIGNYEDNCIMVKNADQRDLNQNQVGDACDLEWEKYLFDRCGNLDVCCGDGILHDGEQCDDGNEIDGDKCMNSCQRNLPCGTQCPVFEMVLIEGGAFTMGSDEGNSDEKPTYMVEVRDFYMSKTEVTVGQYRKCVEAGECSEPNNKNDDPKCNWGYSDRDDHPINCVDWYQAIAFAKWVGKDLPSTPQWEYAARSRGREIEYPWGNEYATCEYAVMDDGGEGCGRGGTWEVCSKTKGNTTQGLCDMGGNVWEWVLDEYHSNDIVWGHYRGGSWSRDEPLFLSSTFQGQSPSNSRYDDLGFRVSDFVP